MKARILLIVCIVLAGVCSCSSAPKRPMQATEIYQKSSNRYELANTELITGSIKSAGLHLQQAYTLATSIDNAHLLCRICLSALVYKLSAPDPEKDDDGKADAFEQSAHELLAEARLYAQWSGSDVLRNICRIYEAKLALHDSDTASYAGHIAALAEVDKALGKEPYYSGFLHRTMGDLHIAQGDYNAAALQYKEAARIHTQNRYLYEIGMDWYYAARAHSLAGNRREAEDAITKALQFDRDAENVLAIAADYEAYASILRKGAPSAEDERRADEAQRRAQKIYAAGGFARSAEELYDAAEEAL